jgi:hypothetical protein
MLINRACFATESIFTVYARSIHKHQANRSRDTPCHVYRFSLCNVSNGTGCSCTRENSWFATVAPCLIWNMADTPTCVVHLQPRTHGRFGFQQLGRVDRYFSLCVWRHILGQKKCRPARDDRQRAARLITCCPPSAATWHGRHIAQARPRRTACCQLKQSPCGSAEFGGLFGRKVSLRAC